MGEHADLPPASPEDIEAFRHHIHFHPKGKEVAGCRYCEARVPGEADKGADK